MQISVSSTYVHRHVSPPSRSHPRSKFIDEFQDELRRQKQANTAQLILQAFVIGSLIVRWFRDRNKGRKPKKPRTPPSGDS